MKTQRVIALIIFLFNCTVLQAADELTHCESVGRIPVWTFSQNGEPAPSPEAICQTFEQQLEERRGREYSFHSTTEEYLSNGEVRLGARRCLYSIDGNPPAERDYAPLFHNPHGLATQNCRYPTLPEDDNENEDLGCNENNSPNPCNVATGNKFRAEVDFDHPTLSFTRYYNSQVPASPRSLMGNHWNHPYQVRVSRSTSQRATHVTRTGRTESFRFSNFITTQFENGRQNPDNEYHLEVPEDHEDRDDYYIVTDPSGVKEHFNVRGQILFREDPNGKRTTFEYNDFFGLTYLDTVTDHYGHSIKFDYELIPLDGFNSIDDYTAETSIDNNGGGTRTFLIETPYQRLSKVTDPFGAVYLYNYDDNHNLVEVIYPDTTSDDSDNPRKTYHYENENFPNHLTGITDENGERYANFAYDEGGRAVVSELGVTTNQVGQEKIELDYQGTN